WNGSAWSALGSNGSGDGALNGEVMSLAVSGGDLYVGGTFTNVAGVSQADRIARWDGSAWSAVGSNPSGNGTFSGYVHDIAISATDLYAGGGFQNGAGIAEADYVARWAIAQLHRPDGRIRLGSGAYVGNDIYNTDGTGQKRNDDASPGLTVTFTVAIQNDGSEDDSFLVEATGPATTHFNVKYLDGATNVTTAVVAGTYETPLLATGASHRITVKVKVKAGTAFGSRVTRFVTSTSVSDPGRQDTVKLFVRAV
ncbi:MAG: hypothetical protein ABIZ34_05560, partial [Candidatus Limnocylindrales bacterium]